MQDHRMPNHPAIDARVFGHDEGLATGGVDQLSHSLRTSIPPGLNPMSLQTALTAGGMEYYC